MGRIDPGRWGVLEGFHDVAGDWRQPPAATVDAVLGAMGATEGDPPPPSAVTMRTDHQMPPLGRGRIRFEEGGSADVDGPPPPDIPAGYHVFEDRDGREHPLVVSPGRVPFPERRQWGFAAQLYAARSARSWGIGDLADLRRLGTWAAGLGAGFTLVNPLHAPSPPAPLQPSPYYPGSRCFLNPLYIAVEELERADQVPDLGAWSRAGRALNDDRRIDRERVWAAKGPALEAVFAAGGPSSRSAPGADAYRRKRGPALDRFAVFCALAEVYGPAWREWPAEYRDPSSAAVERFATSRQGEERVRFHSWLQWILDRQLSAASSGQALVSDLAVGVDPSGPDSWMWQDTFAAGMTVGAPPDEFNTLGQDWGLPPFDPWRLRQAGYAPWVESLRAGLAHGAGLRIDHVMGLFRLYWIPSSTDARSGAYVRYPHHDLLNILALEAERAGAYVVGEDLGTVEEEVRRDLAERRVLSYRVWWFEEQPTAAWPEAAMGAVTTHDLPTVAGLVSGSDLQAQKRIGMQPNDQSAAGLLAKVEARTRVPPDAAPEEAIAGVYADLAAAPCVLLVVSLDDVVAVEERPNMPGTVDSWPNWSLALPVPLEDVERAPLASRLASELARDGG